MIDIRGSLTCEARDIGAFRPTGATARLQSDLRHTTLENVESEAGAIKKVTKVNKCAKVHRGRMPIIHHNVMESCMLVLGLLFKTLRWAVHERSQYDVSCRRNVAGTFFSFLINQECK